MASDNKKPTMEEYQEIQTLGLAEKVEIISTDDDKIKSVGELLSSDSSRNILKLLFEQVLTANQIAQKTGISLPLVIYHLKKMQDLRIVRITNVGKNIKTQDTKFYTSSKFAIVILPSNLTEKAKTSKSLANSFKAIYRFGSIAIAAVATWFVSRIVQVTQPNPSANVPSITNGPVTTDNNQVANNIGPAASTVPATSAGQSAMRVPAPTGAEHGAAPVTAPAIHGVVNGTSPEANTAATTSAGSSSVAVPAPFGSEQGAPTMAPVIHGAVNNTGPSLSVAPTTSAGQSAVTIPAPTGAEHGAAQVLTPIIQAQHTGIAVDILWSVIFTLSVVIAGLVIERVFRAYRH